MLLPFTTEQFFGVFAAYNIAVWPAQVLLTSLAVAATVLVFIPSRWSGRAVSTVLALLWAWIALAYHLAFFSAISPPAYGFAAVSLLGALIFFWLGVVRGSLLFRCELNARGLVGGGLVAFALLVYPAWAFLAGHRYPALATFGLPCPTTIFTIGLLTFAVAPYPRAPLVVPVLWSLVGAQAAFLLDVPQDLALLVAAVVGAVLFWRSERNPTCASLNELHVQASSRS